MSSVGTTVPVPRKEQVLPQGTQSPGEGESEKKKKKKDKSNTGPSHSYTGQVMAHGLGGYSNL